MHLPEIESARLGFIGGTGPEGRGLALRFAGVGHEVVIGSRSRERAVEVAKELRRSIPSAEITGLPNEEAAEIADIVIVTIPYGGVRDTLPPLANACRGKIVVSAVAPLSFQDGRPVGLWVEAGSAAQEVQQLLADSRVVSAFQIVDAHQLQELSSPIDTDILVCSDDAEARRSIVRLAGRLPGIRALSAGRLASSRYVEECTALLVTLNQIYKVHSGLRITGVER